MQGESDADVFPEAVIPTEVDAAAVIDGSAEPEAVAPVVLDAKAEADIMADCVIITVVVPEIDTETDVVGDTICVTERVDKRLVVCTTVIDGIAVVLDEAQTVASCVRVDDMDDENVGVTLAVKLSINDVVELTKADADVVAVFTTV